MLLCHIEMALGHAKNLFILDKDQTPFPTPPNPCLATRFFKPRSESPPCLSKPSKPTTSSPSSTIASNLLLRGMVRLRSSPPPSRPSFVSGFRSMAMCGWRAERSAYRRRRLTARGGPALPCGRAGMRRSSLLAMRWRRCWRTGR